MFQSQFFVKHYEDKVVLRHDFNCGIEEEKRIKMKTENQEEGRKGEMRKYQKGSIRRDEKEMQWRERKKGKRLKMN